MMRLATASLVVSALLACHPQYEKLDGVSTEFEADALGQVSSVTVALDLEVIRSIDQPAQTILEFAPEVREQTFFNHTQLDYNPNGHFPPTVNDVPHYDIHFHGISSAKREAIDCEGETQPEASALPEGFSIPGLGTEPLGSCVPAMGVHAAAEYSETPLNKEMIFGYHMGELIFVEPMIHEDVFKNEEKVEMTVPKPEKLGRSTRWATSFTAAPGEDGLYRFTLSKFVDID